MSGSCPISADNAFGPIIQNCDHADFTLLFEQSVLSIGPSAILLCIAPLRAFGLRHKPIKTLRHRGLFSKLTILTLLAAVELASLVQWAIKPHVSTYVSIPAAVLAFVSAIALVILSYAEHTRCVKPSAVISIYLSLSLLLDIPQARTLFNRGAPPGIAALFVCAMVLKGFALLLEAQNKKNYLMAPYQQYSPEALSSIINRSFQWWVNPLFIRGFRQLLSVEQLFAPDEKISSQELSQVFSRLWRKAKAHKKHPLRNTLLSQLKWQIAATMLPRLCMIGFKFCQPLLINRVTSILSSGSQTPKDSNFLIAATALIYGGLATCTSLFDVQLSRTKAMTRGILVSSIFGKTMNGSDAGDKAPLTLMTNDSVRIATYVSRLIDGMAASFLEIIVALVLLEREIGWVCVVPIILSALAAAWGFWNSGAAVPLQRGWVSASQDRVSFTAKVLESPKALKMLGLTSVLGEKIKELRYKETELSKPMTRFGVLRNTIGYAPQIYAPPATLAIAVLVQGNGYLDVQKAFTTLSIIALLTGPVENLVQSIPMIGSATALLDRIEEFLVKTEDGTRARQFDDGVSDDGMELQELSPSPSTYEAAVLTARNACVGYKLSEPILQNVTVEVKRNTLNIIYGPVGCGKTTFLRAVIGDLSPFEGTISHIPEHISYCAQDSWIPNLSIQDIITMETELDPKWYSTVVWACALTLDIKRMPKGDDTPVGSKGVQLSGGQRQRISLARALYARNSVIVADDVLSGLDAITSASVFSQVFGPTGLCKEHKITAIIATHNKHFASKADNIIMFGPNRNVISQGPYEAVNNYLKAASLAPEELAQDTESVVKGSESKSHIKAAESDAEQDRKRKSGDFSLYAYCFKNVGWWHGILFVVPASMFTFCLGFPSIWLKWWAEEAAHTTSKNSLYISIYFVFAVGSSVLGGLGMLQFTGVIVPKMGRNLHHYLLESCFSAPYAYFATTDTGIILNRFSQDMVMIDTNFAGAAWMSAMFVMQSIMEGALIISGSVYLTTTLPVVMAVLYGIQHVYLRTSRQLRYLDLEAQAPLQTHFLECITGLTTIRAFGEQQRAHAKCLRLLDYSQRPFYLLLCAQVWLALVLNLVVTALAILIITIALNTERNTSAGSIGVSLIGILTFSGTLTNLIKSWTQLETSLGAVARVKNFETTIKLEDGDVPESSQPPQGWPSGNIDFNNATAKYTEHSEPVLADFNLHINAGEKVGICGRSGSGKSSVLLALFRMLEVSAGSVELDGLDIKYVHSRTLRSQMNVVPQEQFILPGSLRFNVDPDGKHIDDEIVTVLEKVGLWSILKNREGGLEAALDQSSLSVGQQQLISVARAMLHRARILVLDEATSSVDSETEIKVMQLIREEFKGVTVIAVAHRLTTLKEFDRVVVLDSGRIVEVGNPADLLATDSTFRDMYERSS